MGPADVSSDAQGSAPPRVPNTNYQEPPSNKHRASKLPFIRILIVEGDARNAGGVVVHFDLCRQMSGGEMQG